ATPLDELIGAVVGRLAPMFGEHRLAVEVAEGLPLADVDYLLVEQVLSNLLENAARYTPPGTAVTVRAVAVAGTDEVEVAVEDHGPGVAEEERERIFDEFYRPRVVGRVLIIDDEEAILRVLGTGLRARGYDVDTATAGAAGLSRAVIENPDVVVLDLGLPDLDGVEVCRRFRLWTEVPIVVLSAHGTEARKVEALDAGADDFVTKPFGMAELEARLRVALRHGARRA